MKDAAAGAGETVLASPDNPVLWRRQSRGRLVGSNFRARTLPPTVGLPLGTPLALPMQNPTTGAP